MRTNIENTKATSILGVGWALVWTRLGATGLSIVLSMAVGVAMTATTSTAHAQGAPPVFSAKQDKISCVGAGVMGCVFTTFLVNRNDACNVNNSLCQTNTTISNVDDPATPNIIENSTICGNAANNLESINPALPAGLRGPWGNGINGDILRTLIPLCRIALNLKPSNNVIGVGGFQSYGAGNEYFAIADSGGQSTFFDVCMTDGVNTFKVGGNPPVAAAAMCGFTFTQKLKQKIGNGSKPPPVAGVPAAPIPGLPIWAVVLLGAGLASGGLLLRRRDRSATSRG